MLGMIGGHKVKVPSQFFVDSTMSFIYNEPYGIGLQ